jgi:predicted NBD/HSP70 family sugar kinase
MSNIDKFTPPKGADQTIVRKFNRAQILNHLRLQGAISRAVLAKQTGLTRSTISRIIDELLSENLVHEIAGSQNDRGRPGILLSLNPKGGAAIGLEIGVHFISILLTDFLSTPIWRNRITLDDNFTWKDYSHKAEDLICQAIEIAKQNDLPLMGIGVAVWGLINYKEHTIQFAPNLHWRDVPLEAKWAQLFHVPVYVENDANASALGEYYFGVGKKIEDFIYMSMDIGVGSGIISKGHLFRGAIGFAGEIGHITIDPSGVLCSCGRRGCLETKVGSHVIIQRYEALSKEKGMNLEKIIQRGQAGDPISRKVFFEVGEALGVAIGHAVNMFNPSGVILGWSLGQAFDLLLPGIELSLQKSTLRELRENLAIMPSMNGADDALLGSIALVLDEIIREAP